ncbi:MAG TPA: hypothetical protein VIG64_14665 [Actinomycetota bacterium]
MTTKTLFKRAQGTPADRVERVLGHPVAYVLTATILLSIFGWTFITQPERVAPTKDPAYYTWRTEVQITEKPGTLLEITGPYDVFSGGYRVASSVIGGYLRKIAGVSSLHVTVFLVVALPVLIALLLGGFAYRQRGDPLIFHAVALGSASLLLTPPFVGYLDNVFCLFFLTASLFFIAPSRDSWRARIAFGLLLLMASFTHPTTLVIFFVVLCAMAAARWVYRRFDLKSVVKDDGPAIVVAFAVIVLTYLIWKVGIWGPSESLSESALPPPYGSDFFLARMILWIKAMRPALNAPLFVIGAVGLLAAGRRAAEDDLARVGIVWLTPLAGIFGFVAGLTYPYYRFFNTTIAWILLPSIGIYFLVRFFIERSRGAGGAVAAVIVVAAMAVLVGTNFSTTLKLSNWNNADGGWLSAAERDTLDQLRLHLTTSTDPDTPVVFVVDEEADPAFQVYGFTKLAGNTSRYGLPPGQIDRGYEYLGSLDNYLAGEPTLTGEKTYDKMSRGFLADTNDGLEQAASEGVEQEPVVVVADIFNESGANTSFFGEDAEFPEGLDENVWIMKDGALTTGDGTTHAAVASEESPTELHAAAVLAGLLLLLVPGYLALRFFLPDAGWAEGLGIVPALSLTMIAVSGIAVLAVVRQPFSTSIAWISLGLAVAAGVVMMLAAEGRLFGSAAPDAPRE